MRSPPTSLVLVTAALTLLVSSAAASRPGRDGFEPTRNHQASAATNALASSSSSPRLTASPVTLLPPYALRGKAGHVPVHESGYFKLNRTADAHMFYMFFESRSATPEDDPLVSERRKKWRQEWRGGDAAWGVCGPRSEG